MNWLGISVKQVCIQAYSHFEFCYFTRLSSQNQVVCSCYRFVPLVVFAVHVKEKWKAIFLYCYVVWHLEHKVHVQIHNTPPSFSTHFDKGNIGCRIWKKSKQAKQKTTWDVASPKKENFWWEKWKDKLPKATTMTFSSLDTRFCFSSITLCPGWGGGGGGNFQLSMRMYASLDALHLWDKGKSAMTC